VVTVSPVIVRRLRRGALCLVVFAASALPGCSSSSARHGVVSVTPGSSLLDQPVRIEVTGLDPDRVVTVALRSADSNGVTWTSRATFRSDGSGDIDLAADPAAGGSYRGVDPMGLTDTMQPPSGHDTDLYYSWSDGTPGRFQVTVTEDGSTVAGGQFSRAGTAAGVTVSSESIAATGFFGEFWKPPPGSPPRPAVLEFGGSEGGLDGSLVGGALASAGYPTLDIAYFGEPGLPPHLASIPLEYFARALRWLARQPGVLPGQVYVCGGSRGGEVALLLGVYYPGLVHGVIASTSSDTAGPGYPDASDPAWTLHGHPLPYTSQYDNPSPTDNPAAIIPVQKIRGPVFLDCGTDDRVWPSCAFAQAIQGRLAAAGDRYPHVLYRYTGAGHFVNGLIPYQPQSVAVEAAEPDATGDTPLADTNADARLWPEVLSFLADPAGHTGTFTAPAIPPPLGAR